MAAESRWRREAREVIAKVLATAGDKPESEIRQELRARYPFGERKYHPYKMWCLEVRHALARFYCKGALPETGERGKQRPDLPGQQKLFGGDDA